MSEAAKKEPRIIKATIVLRFDVWYRPEAITRSSIRTVMNNRVLGVELPAGVSGMSVKGASTQSTDGR